MIKREFEKVTCFPWKYFLNYVWDDRIWITDLIDSLFVYDLNGKIAVISMFSNELVMLLNISNTLIYCQSIEFVV